MSCARPHVDEGIEMIAATSPEPTIEIVSTHDESLDSLLGGGLPRRSLLLVSGDPGAGKTVLSAQIAMARAVRDEQTVFATVTSETNDKLLAQLRGFQFF